MEKIHAINEVIEEENSSFNNNNSNSLGVDYNISIIKDESTFFKNNEMFGIFEEIEKGKLLFIYSFINSTKYTKINFAYLIISKSELKFEKINYTLTDKIDSSLLNARFNFRISKSGPDILIYGGLNNNGEFFKDNLILNVSTNTISMHNWNKEINLFFFSSCRLYNYDYCYGGINKNGNIEDKFFVLSINKVLFLKDLNNSPGKLFGHSSIFQDKEMYIFGGAREYNTNSNKKVKLINFMNNNDLNDYSFSQISNNLYSYNFSTNNWQIINYQGDIPKERLFHSMCKINENSFLIYGGISLNNEILNDFYCFLILDQIFVKIDLFQNSKNLTFSPRYFSATTCIESEYLIILGGVLKVKDQNTNDLLRIILKEDLFLHSSLYNFNFDDPNFDKEEFKINAEEITKEIKTKVEEQENYHKDMTVEINDVNDLLTQLSEEEITKQNNKLKNRGFNINDDEEYKLYSVIQNEIKNGLIYTKNKQLQAISLEKLKCDSILDLLSQGIDILKIYNKIKKNKDDEKQQKEFNFYNKFKYLNEKLEKIRSKLDPI